MATDNPTGDGCAVARPIPPHTPVIAATRFMAKSNALEPQIAQMTQIQKDTSVQSVSSVVSVLLTRSEQRHEATKDTKVSTTKGEI